MLKSLDKNLQYRRNVMRVMLLLVMVGGTTFSAINFYRELWPLATLELVFAFFAFLLWRKILHISYFQRWVSAFLLPFFTTIVYAMYVPNTSVSIFVWIIAIPVISYLLMGRKQGFWVSILFIISGVLVYHYRFIEGNSVIDIAESLNIILGACLMISLAHVYEVNREKNEERLLELASTDTLTGLANRMKLIESFTLYAEYAKRHESHLALVIFDLDYFKNINDEHGHHIGDATLCYIANFIKDRVRKTDLLARFGGEEFVLLIVGAKEKDCYKQVNFLRQELMDTPFIYNGITLAMTVSAGIATYGNDGMSFEELLLKADQRLYLAKDNGRNCVVDSNKEIKIKALQ
jgi:diguanylate cyclase (GGDEF)-like protein